MVDFQVDFEDVALFELLREKSREEGRRDRQSGIALAELALHSLTGCTAALGEDLPNRQAQGWISLANARRMALDTCGADRDFEVAESVWRSGKEPDNLVEAELLVTKACLRWFQLSLKEALSLLNRGICTLRDCGRSVLLAQSLILRASVNDCLGYAEGTLDDLNEALKILDEKKYPYQACTAYTSLTMILLRLGKYEDASVAIAGARSICELLDYKTAWCQLWWVDGLLKKAVGNHMKAERYLLSAAEGFFEHEEYQYLCGILLELAGLYTEQGRRSDANEVTSIVIPFLDTLKTNAKVLKALRLLRESLVSNQLTVATLEKSIALVSTVLRHPLARAALNRSRPGERLPTLARIRSLSKRISMREKAIPL